VTSADLPEFRRALLSWHRRHGLRAPWRESRDPYHVLVAATMAQQTQMSRVLLKYDEFLAAFPTVESLARASTARVLRVWGGLGYNLRALRLQRAAKLIARSAGFPRAAAELERIEGIGPFTAAILSSFAFAEPVAAVDTNVRRVIARLAGDIDGGATDRDVTPAAAALLSRRAPARWNQAMMDLGGRVCTSRAPRCDECPLARWCRGRRKLSRTRVREARAGYDDRLKPVPHRLKPARQAGFLGSRRYYRGRVVQALRELPEGGSIARSRLRERVDGALDIATFDAIVEALARDGLVRIEGRGRVRLP